MAKTLKPEIFIWNAKFETGISEVDQQHQKLVQLINSLARMQSEQGESDELLKLFDELANYAAFHFKMEEDLMQRYHVDTEFESVHQKSHAHFIQQASEAKVNAKNNPGIVTGYLLTFLSKWLIFHILGTDMRMAKEILALESGLPPEAALEQAKSYMSDTNEVLLEAMNELYDNLAARTHDFWEANHRLREEIEIHESTEHELRKLSRVVEHSPVSIIITDANGAIEYVNPKFTQITGYSLQDIAGQTPRVLKSGETPLEEYEKLWATITSGRDWSGEFHNKKKNGELFWERASISPITDTGGKITHFLAIKEDITEKKLVQEDLLRTNTQLANSLSELKRQTKDLTLLNQMNELLQTCLTAEEAYRVIAIMAGELKLGGGGALAVVIGKEKRMETVARWGSDGRMLEAFDFDSCWAIRRGQRHEVSDPANSLVCNHFHAAPKNGYLCLPLVVLGETLGLLHIHMTSECTAEQKQLLVRLSITVGEALKLALSNIRLREALHEQAMRDPLTGLYNRRYLDEALNRELHRASREGKPVSIAMIDIDHFKIFNDTYGHEAGDRVLAETANCIRVHLRQSDVTCRFGGEEFAVVMPDSSVVEAAKRMKDITLLVSALNVILDGTKLPPITISSGIAATSEQGYNAGALIRAADQALYAAKQAGRNCVCTADTHPDSAVPL